MLKTQTVGGLCALLLCTSTLCIAGTDERFIALEDKGADISIPVSVSQEVDNDEASILFYALASDTELDRANARVIEQVNRGMKELKQQLKSVSYKTRGLSSWPRYAEEDKTSRRVIGWEVRQEIQATVTNAANAAAVAQTVSRYFAFESISFQLSREKRHQAQQKLTESLVAQVSERIHTMVTLFGGKGRHAVLRSLDFGSNGYSSPAVYRATNMSVLNSVQKASKQPLPAFEPGVSRVSMDATAKIVLLGR